MLAQIHPTLVPNHHLQQWLAVVHLVVEVGSLQAVVAVLILDVETDPRQIEKVTVMVNRRYACSHRPLRYPLAIHGESQCQQRRLLEALQDWSMASH